MKIVSLENIFSQQAKMNSDVEHSVHRTVKIWTLGRFIIEVDQKPPKYGAKIPRKPLELLKVLIALGGESVSEENLSEALWPESDGDHAHNAFATTLKRLRTLIGRQSLHLQDSRLTLDPHWCWVDAQQFTELLNLASQASHTGDAQKAWNYLNEALSLYKGPFLEGEFDPPDILSTREKLHSLFIRHIEEVGGFLIQNQQLEKAIALFQRGLEIDDLAEAFCRHLMRCFQQEGRLAEGIAVYQRYCQVLQAKMEIDPSPETREAYQSLLNDQKSSPPPSKTPMDHLPEPSLDTARPSPSLESSMISGERRQVTVIFFVLSDYTALSEKLDPEEVGEIMERIKTEAQRIVAYHGGIINLAVQEQLIALFGIPITHEDDPLRAVRAAMELHETLDQISLEVKSRIGLPLRLHTGLNTGLIVTHLGDSREGHYGITGDVMTICAHLAERAQADEILLSAETNRLIASFFETDSLEPFQLKSTSKPLAAYRVKFKSKVETRFEAARKRGLTTFVGRDRELETLQNTLEKAVAGEGQFITVVGEAGVGKSRLRYEFTHGPVFDQILGGRNTEGRDTEGPLRRSRRSGVPATATDPTGGAAASASQWRTTRIRPHPLILEGRCQSYGSETPYFPFINVFKRGLGLLEEDTPAQLLEKTVTQLKAIEPDLEQYFPLYLHLLSIQNEDYPLPENLQGPALAAAIRDALSAIFILIAKTQPLVVILEDWHWSDEASQTALKNLLGVMSSSPMMLMVLYRPEFSSSWGNPSHHTPLALKPLEIRHSESILKATLKANQLPEGLAALIHERTGGNPFFIEEVCATLVDEGSLTVRKEPEGRTQVDLTHSLEHLTLPETVQAVIRTRLDRLAPHIRETLGLASVIGREFTRTILSQVSNDPTRLSSTLEELKALELIRQTHLLPEAKYMFKHFITREVTYESLLLKQRASLHHLVGETIEVLYAERLEEQYEVLAYHYSKSEAYEKALHYLELAGDKAARNFSLVDARNYYKVAIDLIDSHEKTELLQRKRIEAGLKWAQISQYAQPEMYPSLLRASLDDARDLNDELEITRLSYWLGVSSWYLGNYNQAMDYLSDSNELANQLKEETLMAQSYGFMGLIYIYEPEFIKSKEFFEKAIGLFEGVGNQWEMSFFSGLLGMLLGSIGNFEKGIVLVKKALELSEETENLIINAHANVVLSRIHCNQGSWQASIDAGVQAIETSRQIGNAVIEGFGMCHIGYSHFMLNNQKYGINSICEGIQKIENTGSKGGLTIFYSWLAECYALTGRVRQAIDAANKTFQLILNRQGLGEAKAYQALAMATAQESSANPQTVDQTMQKSLHLAQERGQRPDLAIGYFRYAKILSDRGAQQQAQESLNQAVELYSEMKMGWWLEQAKELEKHLG